MLIAILGLCAAIVSFALYHMNARMNMNLSAYTLFLLLSEHSMEDHARKIHDFVKALDESDAVNSVVLAQRAVQRMADDMSRGLTRGGFILALAARIREVRGQQSI
jgi:cobalamin biosynthesis protein CobD/CbiB